MLLDIGVKIVLGFGGYGHLITTRCLFNIRIKNIH